ncbi:MAG: glycine zipper 2TM domain-containing protein [Pseudomonas sp.]|nr:glycine zipper 2TM domain-containing protein [Pseudomonas sp.]
MNKSMLVGAVLGAVGVTAGGAVATYSVINSGPKFAQVVAVQPVTETIKTPRQVCKEVTLTKRRPVKDEHKIAGTLLGAVAGGLLGNQVGGGNGKKIATVAGAAAGGYAGNTVQGNMQEGDTYTTTETRCSTVTDSSEKIIGYDVKYQLDGLVNQVRMDRDPGAQIPLNKDGQLVLVQQMPAAQ